MRPKGVRDRLAIKQLACLSYIPKVVEHAFIKVRQLLTNPKTSLILGEKIFYLLGKRKNSHIPSPRQIDTILIVRLDEIGDVVMTSAFLRELRNAAPQARITLLVKPKVLNFVERCPYVDEVLSFTCDDLTSDLNRHVKAIRFSMSNLWAKDLSLAIIPRWDTDISHATFLAYFSGARWRIGYSETVNRINRLIIKVMTFY